MSDSAFPVALTAPVQSPVVAPPAPLIQPGDDPHVVGARLLDAFLRKHKDRPQTERAYRKRLRQLARFSGLSLEALCAAPIVAGRRYVEQLVESYDDALKARKAAVSTRAAQIAVVGSYVKWLRVEQLVDWAFTVKAPKPESYLDTAGPGTGAVRALLAAAARRDPKTAARDTWVLRALHDLALRRGELESLEFPGHVVFRNGAPAQLLVLGKGKDARRPIALPRQTRLALAAWLAARGDAPGPLTTSLAFRHRKEPFRLCGRGIARILTERARQAAVERANPHSLRHTAITTAHAKGATIADAADYGRHSTEISRVYHDNMDERVLRVAQSVADAL